MLISPAYAQAAGGGQGGFDIVALPPLILIFVVFYFLLIRPQQKRMKEHRNMVQALRRGDRVVTAGGLIGSVTKVVNDNELQVEVAEGVRVRVVRNTIQEVLSKTEPAQKDQKEEGESGQKAANDPGDKGKGIVGKLLGGGSGDGQSKS
jgi:preprotein translocase subunit YajC